ncbi:Recombination-associated protein RdgC [Sinobacterium norvegicum]|uniref:Recombination-associated protein RdgC n=1 Tax=Sinobacterium norvegicum TaxID=1641715 RepID=A0ABM9AHG3_9GAMM|nr:recombination-associated protein RdgC [Sinobacterium norvegicum]CAH0992631.1 Recombination-associated protein RdgC [Sinobacterium norvegicum]
MWFKNILVYRLTSKLDGLDKLEELLESKAFQGCGSQDTQAIGWVSPMGRHGKLLSHTANGFHMVCAQRQERVLPSSVINEAVEDKIADLEEQQARKVYRKERVEMKDEVIMELLPRAFTKSSKLFAYIDEAEGLLIVNTTSANRAEELLNLLRESIGSLPLVPLMVASLPADVLTLWLKAEALPEHFLLGNECELRDPQNPSNIVRAKDQDLYSEEIAKHIEVGKRASKLAMIWNDAINFTVTEEVAIQKIKFSEVVQEKASDTAGEDEQFDSDFAVMTLELRQLIKELTTALGGIAE